MIVGGVLATLLKAQKQRPAKREYVYASLGGLLTKPELDAFRYLCRELQGVAHICPKVRIADLLKVDKNRTASTHIRAAFNAIAMKHVDFVVVSPEGEVRFAVEVDDASHRRSDRQARDVLVNRAFEQANLPLVRIGTRNFEKSTELRALIGNVREQRVMA